MYKIEFARRYETKPNHACTIIALNQRKESNFCRFNTALIDDKRYVLHNQFPDDAIIVLEDVMSDEEVNNLIGKDICFE